MANIHTIRDLEAESGRAPPTQPIRNYWGGSPQQVRAPVYGPADPAMMGGGIPMPSDPFWSDNVPPGRFGFTEMCMMQCCPCCVGPCCSPVRQHDYIRLLKTFTFWISVVQVIYFIVSVAIDGMGRNAGPSTAALLLLGAKYAPYIKHYYHLHRLLLPAILHGSIWHILFNLLFQWRMMLYQEAARSGGWGLWRTMTIFWVSTVSASLMSCVLYPLSVGVGSSGALAGIFGAFCVVVARDWRQSPKMLRYNYIIMIFTFLFGLLMFGFLSTNIDQGAHLGGLLAGIFVGMIVLTHHTIARVVGAVLLGSLFAIEILIFAFVVNV